MLRACTRPTRLGSLRPCTIPRPTLARTYTSSLTPDPSGAPRGSARALLLTTGVLTLGVTAYLFWPNPKRGAPTRPDAPLSPTHFTPATLVSSVPAGPSTRFITLQLPPGAWPPASARPPGPADAPAPIWSVFLKDSDLEVERAYTPLFGASPAGTLAFWIKKYPRGEVARWLHARVPGDVVELRGPMPTWPWADGRWDEIVMVRAPPPRASSPAARAD